MSHSNGRVVTSGVQGSAAPRLEINDLLKPQNIKQWSLYIQAFAAFQNAIQDDTKSYFQIAGIHGLPAKAWDGAGGNQQAKGSRWPGYCFHSSTLFPTWHRPYIALFEQLLNQHAVEIAKKYTTDTAAWAKAAQDLRAPYWDWVENIVPPSAVISDETLKIAVAPDGRIDNNFKNPLIRYTFHPLDKNYNFPEASGVWKSTVRYPKKTTEPFDPNEKGDVNQLIRTLKNNQISIRDKVVAMLFFAKTWPEFSNYHRNEDGSDIPALANSIESIHNDLHNFVGGTNPRNDVGGHMTDPAVAAFDPIFWLHHTNVDRLLSLWSEINPTQWVTPDIARRGTWSIAANARLDNNTDLQPFSMSETAFWPSSQTKDVSRLNYSYIWSTATTNLVQKSGVSQASFSAAAVAKEAAPVAKDAAPVEKGFTHVEKDSAPAPNEDLAAAVFKKFGGHLHSKLISLANSAQTESLSKASALPTETSGGGSYFDWTARIRCEKYAVNGSFLVLVFLGPVPTHAKDWLLSKSYIGSHAVFSRTAASIESCGNCSDQHSASLVVEGFVHLSSAFQEHDDFPTEPGADALQPDVVVPYLKKNLSWRVLGNKTVKDIPSLEFDVFYAPITLPVGASRPIQGAPVQVDLELPQGGIEWE